MIVLAHVGHWLNSAIYLAPVALAAGVVGALSARDRLTARRATSASRCPTTEPPAEAGGSDAARGVARATS